jgi:Dockerin type I domain
VPLRGVYVYTRFDPAEAPRAIALNGTRNDRGIDTNANGLFERLQIDLGVDLLASGSCDWSARLVDRNGAELGFATGSGSLAAGARTIRFEFDGRAIAANGLDGPFSVRSLLMSCSNGANLVATFAGDTSAWRANQFEGFIVRAPGDLNGDGRVDAADIAVFNLALGTTLGDANYNRFADFDRDGRITLNDLRIFRRYLPR